MVNQLKGTFETKDPNIIKYSDKAHALLKRLEENGGKWSLVQILRSENKADLLAKSTTENETLFQKLKLKEELISPSIEENEMLSTFEIAEWMKPIAEYLNLGKLTEDKDQARKI